MVLNDYIPHVYVGENNAVSLMALSHRCVEQQFCVNEVCPCRQVNLLQCGLQALDCVCVCVVGCGRCRVPCFCSTGLSGFRKDDDHIRLKAARITFCPVVALRFLMAGSLCKPENVDHPC